MKILVACEESQRVTVEMRKLGHEAFSCDIQNCSGIHPEWHIQEDVLPLLNGRCSFKTNDGAIHNIDGRWDMIIAFPPCTHLTCSGQWAYAKGFKDVALREQGAEFFMAFANADCERIAIENPIGIMSTRWRKPDQIIQPWMFGHNATKATCLWLKGLPSLKQDVTEKPPMDYFEWVDKKTGQKKRYQRWQYDIRCISDRKVRAQMASKTFEGIAKAMAKQWTDI